MNKGRRPGLFYVDDMFWFPYGGGTTVVTGEGYGFFVEIVLEHPEEGNLQPTWGWNIERSDGLKHSEYEDSFLMCLLNINKFVEDNYLPRFPKERDQ